MHNVLRSWQQQPPAFRLSAAYMAIIMAISLVFSLILYQLSVGQLSTSLSRQYTRLRSIYGTTVLVPANPQQIETELAAGKRRLALQLFYFNGVILALGTGLSYWLARRTLQPIEDALQSQARFAADASHELRTPLAAMQSEIEVALRDPKLSREDAAVLLNSNLEEVAKLRTLADGLLRLARSERSDIPTVRVGLANIAQNAVAGVAASAASRQITVANDVPDGLATTGDATALSELIVILLDNAIKYSPEHTTIRLTAWSAPNTVHLSVADQGQGIDPADLPHIFDRFYRADPARSPINVPGTGLGLSLARQIVELHSGSIHVASTVGHGSTFTVNLPSA